MHRAATFPTLYNSTICGVRILLHHHYNSIPLWYSRGIVLSLSVQLYYHYYNSITCNIRALILLALLLYCYTRRCTAQPPSHLCASSKIRKVGSKTQKTLAQRLFPNYTPTSFICVLICASPYSVRILLHICPLSLSLSRSLALFSRSLALSLSRSLANRQT